MDKTTLFDIKEIENAYIIDTLNEVYESLLEKGYNPINQIVGYLISGDPGYISSYRDSRTKISALDRSKIVEIILRDYMRRKWSVWV